MSTLSHSYGPTAKLAALLATAGELDAAVLGGHREPGLRAEEGLVLHAHLVVAGHDDVGIAAGIAAADPDVPEDVAAARVVVLRRRRVHERRACVHGRARVGDRVE